MRSILWLISTGVVFFVAFSAFGETPATPYRPAHTLTVVSESVGPKSPFGKSEGIFWQIVPETCGDGSFCLGFYREEAGEPIGRLTPGGPNAGLYFADGSPFANTVYAWNLMLFPGFNVPCDILPVNAACDVSEPAVVEIRRQTGESTFMEKLEIECSAISSADALARGWIRETEEDAGTLVMIGVTNLKTGENVSRQLWVPGDFWWLYEETPYRRSWRLR